MFVNVTIIQHNYYKREYCVNLPCLHNVLCHHTKQNRTITEYYKT